MTAFQTTTGECEAPFDTRGAFWVVDPETNETLGIYEGGSFTTRSGIELRMFAIYLLHPIP